MPHTLRFIRLRCHSHAVSVAIMTNLEHSALSHLRHAVRAIFRGDCYSSIHSIYNYLLMTFWSSAWLMLLPTVHRLVYPISRAVHSSDCWILELPLTISILRSSLESRSRVPRDEGDRQECRRPILKHDSIVLSYCAITKTPSAGQVNLFPGLSLRLCWLLCVSNVGKMLERNEVYRPSWVLEGIFELVCTLLLRKRMICYAVNSVNQQVNCL